MTLVVGRLQGNVLRLVADWRISHPDAVPHYRTGGLKLIVLHPYLVCGYAGHVHTALELLRRAPVPATEAPLEASHVEALLAFLSQAQRAGAAVDFIVGSDVHGRRALAQSKEGVIERGLAHAWIGDLAAFEAFQRSLAEVTAQSSPLEPEMESLREAIEAGVIRGALSRAILTGSVRDSIGEADVCVGSGVHGFEYLMSTGVMLTQDFVFGSTEDAAEHEAINAAARAIDGGRFAWRQLCPTDPGVAALGLFFEQGPYAVVAEPLKRDESLEFSGLDVDQLLQTLDAQHGLRLR